MIGRTSMRRASSQTRLSSMQASASFLDIGFISFSTRYTRQNYFWVRLDSRSITGLCGEACALERSDAPIRIGAQLGREGVQGLERALDRSAVGGGLRSQEANLRQRDIRRRQAASLVLGRRAHASERSAQAPEAITGFASSIVARMRGSYHSAVRRLRASASARSSTLVAEGNRARPQRAMKSRT